MRRWKLVVFAVAFVGLFQMTGSAGMSSVRRELQKMTGYVVMASDTVGNVSQGEHGKRRVTLRSGKIFEIDASILTSTHAGSDVIVFAKPLSGSAKPLSGSAKPQYPATVEQSYRLLIDDEIVDATPVVIRVR